MIVTKPILSKSFDIDDIRKIRTYNAERYKNMTAAEIVADTRKGAERVLNMLDPTKYKRVSLADK